MSFRMYNVTPVGKAAKVNSDLAQLKKQGDPTKDARHGSNNLSVPIVPLDGADDAAATHLGGSTWAGDEKLKEEYQKADGNLWWLFEELGGPMIATNVAVSEKFLGEPRSFDACLADAGLMRRVGMRV